MLSLANFLGSLITLTINLPEGFMYYQASALETDLPISIYA